MVYTLTYSNIHESEKKIVGNRALYLSKAVNKSVAPCIFFAVTSVCFEEFYEYNELKGKIDDLLRLDVSEDFFWSELKKVFFDAKFPSKLELDIKESYDAISVSSNVAGNILRSFEARINVFLSSSSNFDLEGVFLNIKGFDNLLTAIKSCWFQFVKSQGVLALKNSLDFSVGVIIEKFISSDLSVEVELSSDKKNLLIKAYKGLPEVSHGIIKDNYILSFNHLEFLSYELNHQNFSILHQDESGVLLKKRLGREGADDKASKQIISECARLAKKTFSLIDEDVRVIFIIKNSVPYLFLVERVNFDENVEDSSLEDVSLKPEVGDSLSEDFSVTNIMAHPSDIASSAEHDSHSLSQDEDLVVSNGAGFSDSDEFILQDEQKVEDSDDVYSSFFKLVELLEEDLLKSYKESFGFAPSTFKDAVLELDSKHGFDYKEKVLKVLDIKSLIMSGESVDEDIVFAHIGLIEDFLRRDSE